MNQLSTADSSSNATDPWSATVAAACDGSRQAQSRLFADLRSYLRSRAAAGLDPHLQVKVSPSDLVQETLMEAYQSFERFEGKTRAELLVWLQGILKHRLLTAQRKFHKAEKRSLRREVHIDQAQASGSRWAVTDNERTSPSGQVMANEERERLETAMTRLPERQEQAVRLRNELRLSFEEVGKVLGCSAGAAQKLWSRAIERLAEELTDEESSHS
ncbi:sigma-70 family RNA polymerase sigma factor [Aeoliella sp. ICT_H6.2]|uniref:Sigma-70 family RNA polymerase sigma factor n=1 Tax=Aeoliella straminimaris TaxID=2954799 RepID=A0A9X2FBN5_9BACT|nr:sigma-70 family RNA polymerase sigma factor [Aeoliella straminimaris]